MEVENPTTNGDHSTKKKSIENGVSDDEGSGVKTKLCNGVNGNGDVSDEEEMDCEEGQTNGDKDSSPAKVNGTGDADSSEEKCEAHGDVKDELKDEKDLDEDSKENVEKKENGVKEEDVKEDCDKNDKLNESRNGDVTSADPEVKDEVKDEDTNEGNEDKDDAKEDEEKDKDEKPSVESTPEDTPSETPAETPADTPADTPAATPSGSREGTPAGSKEGTPAPEGPPKVAKYKLFEKCGTDTEDMRPMAKMLYSLGADLCKQTVFKDLIRVQEKKKAQNKLEEIDADHIDDLKDVYEKLQERNDPYIADTTACERCQFKSESINIVEWHKEFAHNQEEGMYSCSFCDFETKFPGQFFYHMEAIHNRKGRIYMRPSFFNCPMCPFENSTKNALKKHLLKCERTFSLKRNLEPAPTDCDIPLKKPKAPPPPKKAPPKPVLPAPSKGQVLGSARPAVLPAPVKVGGSAANSAAARQAQQMQQQFQQLAQRMGAPGISLLPGTGVNQAPTYAIGNQVFTLVNQGGQFMLQPTGGTVPAGYAGAMGNMRMPMMNPTMLAQQAAAVNQAMLALQAQHNAKQQGHQMKKPVPSLLNKNNKAPTPPPTSKPKAPVAPISKPNRPGQSPGKKSQFEICEICGGFVKDRESLRIHFYWAHKVDINKEIFERKEPHLACNACSSRFWTYQGYRWHQRMKHNNTSMPEQPPGTVKQAPKYFCAVCRSHTITNLLLHLLEVHRISVDMVCEQKRCPMCGVTFKSSANTRHHLYNSHKDMFKDAPILEGKKKAPTPTKPSGAPVPTGMFENTVSSARTPGKSGTPKKSAQPAMPPMGGNKFEPVCSICDLTFPNVEAFTNHCNKNHVFNCYRCSTKWSTADQLNNHFNREHRFEQEFCQLCDDKVTIGRPYIRHVKRSHLRECSVMVMRLSPEVVENICERYAETGGSSGRVLDVTSPRKVGPKNIINRMPEDAITIIDDDSPEKPYCKPCPASKKPKYRMDDDAGDDEDEGKQETMEVDGETIVIEKSDD